MNLFRLIFHHFLASGGSVVNWLRTAAVKQATDQALEFAAVARDGLWWIVDATVPVKLGYDGGMRCDAMDWWMDGVRDVM